METIILAVLFFVLMLIEILTDNFEIKEKKKMAHIMQLVLIGFSFGVGAYYGWRYGLRWEFLWLIGGMGFLRLAFFNPILNDLMGWPRNYKGKTDIFDSMRLWIEKKIVKWPEFFIYAYALIAYCSYPIFLFFGVICFHHAIR